MRYLITAENVEPFFTKWFEPENNFNEDIGMVVYDLVTEKYTYDGKTWHIIENDNL